MTPYFCSRTLLLLLSNTINHLASPPIYLVLSGFEPPLLMHGSINITKLTVAYIMIFCSMSTFDNWSLLFRILCGTFTLLLVFCDLCIGTLTSVKELNTSTTKNNTTLTELAVLLCFLIGNWSLAYKNTQWLYYSLPVYWYTRSLKLFWRRQFAVKHLCAQGGLNSWWRQSDPEQPLDGPCGGTALSTAVSKAATENLPNSICHWSSCDIIQSSRTATQWKQVFPMSRTNA